MFLRSTLPLQYRVLKKSEHMSDFSTLPSTLSLIGMPGAGKSTIGVLLAKQTGHRFVDTDIDIQATAGASLQDILEQQGYQALRKLEERVLLTVAIDNAIISTGGSVIYSQASMERLHASGPVIYLETPLEILEQRIASAPPRGIASDSTQSFADIYAERVPLYERHADITITSSANSPDEIARLIVEQLRTGIKR